MQKERPPIDDDVIVDGSGRSLYAYPSTLVLVVSGRYLVPQQLWIYIDLFLGVSRCMHIYLGI